MDKKKRKNMWDDKAATSSTIDSLFFLCLISIAAVILMPSAIPDGQDEALCYKNAQELDMHLLGSLLSSKMQGSEYTHSPLAIAGIDTIEDPAIKKTLSTSFAKEQNHRTYSDLIAEDLMLQMKVQSNESSVCINPMAEDHARMTSTVIQSYLDTKIAGTYSYRLEASWYPVAGYPIRSNIVIGDENPKDAIVQNAKISIPSSYTTSRSSILETMNDTYLMEALEKKSIYERQESIMDGFNRSINVAALGPARQISASVFPAAYLKSLMSSSIMVQGEKDRMEKEREMAIALLMLESTENNLKGADITIPEEQLSLELVELIEEELTAEIQNSIASYIRSDMAFEINCTAS